MNKVSKAVLCKMYLDDCMPMHVIAKELGVSIGTVYNYCHKYGIETRKTADVLRGRNVSDETRRKISRANKGRKFSEETKKRMSDAQKVGGIGHKKKRKDGYIAIYFPDHPRSNKDGYIMEHILVAECLIGRPLSKDEVVHHKNHRRDDNRVSNLQLMTKEEHMRMHTIERHRNGGIPTHNVKVINITTGEVFYSVKKAAEAYGVNSTNISRACRNSKRTAKGCRWQYAE